MRVRPSRILTTLLTLALAACGGGGGGSGSGDTPPSNQPPQTFPDYYNVAEDQTLNVTISSGVLWNDFDPDHDIMSVAVVATAGHGTLVLNADGSLDYTPAGNFNGLDTFTYTVSDGTLTSAPVMSEITVSPVNDAPVAVADAIMTDEDVLLVLPAPGLLVNDSDIDGTPLTASYVTLPQHGNLAPSPDGSLTYWPHPDYSGPDSYTYRAHDGSAYSPPVTVSITVNPVNDAPVAGLRNYLADGAGQVNAAAPGILAGATDADGDIMTAIQVTPPSHGTLTLNANGSFSYTATGGYTGVDSFTWKAGDGTAFSADKIATIIIGAITPGDAYLVVYTYELHGPNSMGGVMVIPTDGAAPYALPGYTLPPGAAGPFNGLPPVEIAVNASRTFLYTTHQAPAGILVRKHDLTLQTTSDLATVPSYVIGLDFDPADAQGWLYMTEFNPGPGHAGDVWRVHPVTGAVEKLLVSSGISDVAMGTAVGKDTAGAGTAVYIIPYHIFGGFPNWLYKRVGNAAVPCVQTPVGIDYLGLCHVGGAVTDAQGRLYMVGMWDNKIYRYTDTDGDGLFLEAGTAPEVFATLPIPDADGEHQVLGLAIASNGSLLVNVKTFGSNVSDIGIYWVKDANPAVNAPDGTPAEIVVRVSETNTDMGDYTNTIAAPR